MARRCFFSFYYDRDVWRSQQVKNVWVTHTDREAAGFFNSSAFETAKKSDAALRTFLNAEMKGSSVVCALIGTATYSRRWVRYELVRGFEKGKGLLGVRIHGLKNKDGETDTFGPNPFDYLGYEWNKQTDVIRFKESKNGSWQWFTDLPTMKYADLPFALSSTDSTFSHLFSTYDYVNSNGYSSIGNWIEAAAKAVGR